MHLKSFFTVLSVLLIVAGNAGAVDVAKIDTGKTGGKFADWVQKQKENYQHTVEQISESQFATTIGNGIKAAKQGIQFAKDQYKAVMDLKDSVMNSTAVQAAKLSQQIATETKKLNDLKKEYEQKKAEEAADAELAATEQEEKAQLTAQNNQTLLEIYEQELAEATTDEAKAAAQQKIDALQKTMSAANTTTAEEENDNA